MFCRGLRRFVRRRFKGRGSYRGVGYGAPRFSRTCVASSDDATSYLGSKGKGGRGGSGKGHGRRKIPRGRDGSVMTCRVCSSDEHFAARCPQGKGGGKGGTTGSSPTFRTTESGRAEGGWTWHGLVDNGDEPVEQAGPLTSVFQQMGRPSEHVLALTAEEQDKPLTVAHSSHLFRTAHNRGLI